MTGPRILLYDIETAPMLGYVWGLWDNNVALNQLHSDWHLLSWAAKWMGEKEIMYADQRKKRNLEDDSAILKKLWKLLDEADIVVGHNSKKFDTKKVNARFLLNGIKPPSPFRQIDTLAIARKHFALTSNKLEYLSGKLCPSAKKYDHKEFSGFKLWAECMKRNQSAFREMEVYNKRDILALEGVFKKLYPWDPSINLSAYTDGPSGPRCGCKRRQEPTKKFCYTDTGKFQLMRCTGCGAWSRSRYNENSIYKRREMKGKISG